MLAHSMRLDSPSPVWHRPSSENPTCTEYITQSLKKRGYTTHYGDFSLAGWVLLNEGKGGDIQSDPGATAKVWMSSGYAGIQSTI
jgi:hypothetical protein